MKLLLTMNLPYTRAHGGANRANRGLCADLARCGHKVRVVVPALATPATVTLDQLRAELAADSIVIGSLNGIDIFTLDGVEVYSVTEPSTLRSTLVDQIHDFAPDWVLVSSEDPSQSLLDASHKSAPGRVIYLAHTPQLFPFGPHSLYPGEARTSLVRQAAGTVCISRCVTDYVKQWSGIDAACIHSPHYGAGPWPNLASLDNPYVLLMNASAIKGLPIFLQLADALPHIQFAALRGYATTQADLDAMSRRPNVTLLPNAKDLDDILLQTRILLMPSLWAEGFGMATVDAMLRGIPVLAAAFGGLLEAKLGTDYLLPVRPIEHFEETLGDNMLPIPIVPEQDIRPWLQSLTSLLNDRDLYERQSAAARAAATSFVSGLSAKPFVEWLGTLKPGSATSAVKPKVKNDLAALTPEQRAALVERLKKKTLAQGSRETARIPAAQRNGHRALSFAQQRLWFMEKLEPGRYNVATGLSINGPLHVDLLARSLNEVIARHEILRTTFIETDGEPQQVILPELRIDLPVRSLSPESGGPFDDVHRPFDLARGPLLRPVILQRSEDEHLLVLTMHHIISDGWSTGVLIRELSTLYDAYLQNRPSPLSPLPIQYLDYAVWQREYLQGDVLERQLNYWKEQLAEAPALLTLPTDFPRPNVQSGRGAAENFSLPEELSVALRQLSQHEGATLFMTLLAAFKVLLQKYSGQDDLVIGSPIAGRNRREVEGLIGFFVNTLALRTRLSGNPTFSELLKRVREVCVGAYAHQELPFERLVEELQPERSLSHNPIFQVVFELENQKPGSTAARDSESWAINRPATAIFELILSLKDTGRELQGVIEYSTDLFTAETIQSMIQHFRVLLTHIVSNPARPISDFPILSTQEEQKLLQDGSGGDVQYSRGQCLHQLFEAQVQRSPASIAIRCDDESISRSCLNRRANQLAHYLQALQVGPETLVGICMGRGIDIVISMLAVFKAGAAYVPIDPSLPLERIDYLIKDTRTPVVITLEQHRDAFEHTSAVRVICLDSESISQYPGENCASSATAENLAYVMYTSGSTGNPKGVAITHENLNWLAHNLNQLGITEGDTVANASNPAFDAIVYEVWCGLVHGASVEVIASDTMLSASDLGVKLRESGVSVLYVTAALFTQLASQDPAIFSSIRTVVTGGESLAERWAWEVMQRGRPERLIHEYGPTEATVFSSIQVVQDAHAEEKNVPIGRPLSNTTSYVLDKWMRPVPVGIIGELYIGGDGVARGYWGSAEQTAARFVPDPHARRSGQRLYRTGDFVKWLRSGELEFVGRADNQVKIRGYRVELGEVEAALSKLAGVKESVVLVCEEGGEKRLVGYVVSEQTLLTNAELRRRLKERLPEYMMPSAFVLVDQMPLTPNGKVDRRKLLTTTPREHRHEDVLPDVEEDQKLMLCSEPLPEVKMSSAVEELLTNVWAELLRVEEIKADDNFFELGGHSLLAMRLTSRIRSVFGVELSPRTVFESPTIAALAEEIESKREQDGAVPTTPLRRIPRDQPLPLSYAQQRLWFLDQLQPGSTAYTVARGTGVSGALNVEVLRASFNELVRRHESLRTTFAAFEGEPVQIIAAKQELHLPVVDLTELPETEAKDEARSIAATILRQPFVLSDGPLIRVVLIRTAPEEHLLLLTMHHIISDHWSLGVLFGELFALYYAYLRGEESPLAELPIQYADYAMWQQDYLKGELLQTQLDYWEEQLAGAPELMDLRTDYARPATRTTKGRSEFFTVPLALSESLRQLSRGEGVTLFMTLLAAFQVLLFKYSGQTDLVIGSPIAGRQRSELEGLIGFFVNTLALRVDLAGNPKFGELLRKVREVCLGAYAHQDLPFERLVEELQPERSLSHNPLIQVMFELENVRQGAARQNNQQSPPPSETAIFDLVLSLQETGDEIQGTFEYSTDLFAAPTIQRMVQHFLTLLEQIVSSPQAQLSELSLVSTVERNLLLSEWSGADQRHRSLSRQDVPLVHALFEQHAARTPDATAIRFSGRSVSYAELNASANQLAHLLVSHGVKSESLVGVMLPRSPELIVALLATLKAGGAYLPLDPAYPIERLASMFEDAEASLLVTTSEFQSLLPATTVPVICLDEVATLCSEQDTDDLHINVAPESLAYVIYTSGSSGAPKGVMISHAALADYLRVVIERLELNAADRFLQFASSSFDVAVEEIFPTLAAGAQLVLCEEVPYGDEFTEMLEREQVTVCELPTAFWQEWVRELDSQKQLVPEALRLLIAGGEKNTAESVRRWRRIKREQTRLFHCFGVTEATVTSLLYELGADESEVVMPLGGVLRNSETYVLDERMNPVPIGVYGELYFGGSNLGRGYRNKPEATAEKYVPHPYSRNAGERLYRTGDIVRWRTPALLEFIGRADGLVKVRGFRIELGEIETAIKRHISIRDAVVEVVEKAEGDNRIVAYLVYKEHGLRPEMRHWFHSLKEKLPAYMVPSLFMTVDHLPLTPNGKIDRQALPKPDWSEVNAQKPYVGPTGATQLRIQQIWEKIFGFRPISVTADFFELGGHSLLAVRLMSDIQKQFGRDLPLSVLFQGATVERLSIIVDNKEASSFVNPLVGINVEGTRRPFFCCHGVGGNLVSYLELARQLGPDQPFYGLQTPLQEFGQQFNSLEEMAACYVKEIRNLQPEGPYLIGGWSMGGIIAFEMAHQFVQQGEKVGLLAVMDVGPPVDKHELETDAELIKTSLEFVIESFNISMDLFASDWEHILQLEQSEERLRYVIEKAQVARMLPPDLAFEPVCRLYDQINTNFRVLRDYNPKVYPGEITFFKAEHCAFENEVEDLKKAWAALSDRELTMHLFPCSHWEMIHRPHVDELANLLRTYFDRVETQKGTKGIELCEELILQS